MSRDEVQALDETLSAWAEFSDDSVYRYLLGRSIGLGTSVLWVMLNPSTASAFVDDPTIRRVRSFSARQRAGTVEVVNLYAYRATKPNDLRQCSDPVGPDNDSAIAAAVARADFAVAAWGGNKIGRPHVAHVAHVLELLAPVPLFTFGVNGDGAPRHPLYLPSNTPLEPWRRFASVT